MFITRKVEADKVLSCGKNTPELRRHFQDLSRKAKLWCIFSDLEPEQAEQHYEWAWQISNQFSGCTMCVLGRYHFMQGNYVEAIACLKQAIRIHPLLSHLWYILGYAYMWTEDWEGARNAFSHCVAIDKDDGESWSNLTSIYLYLRTNWNTVEVWIFLDFYIQVMNSLNFILCCWTTTL